MNAQHINFALIRILHPRFIASQEASSEVKSKLKIEVLTRQRTYVPKPLPGTGDAGADYLQ